jgi:hypothetical protein
VFSTIAIKSMKENNFTQVDWQFDIIKKKKEDFFINVGKMA